MANVCYCGDELASSLSHRVSKLVNCSLNSSQIFSFLIHNVETKQLGSGERIVLAPLVLFIFFIVD